MTDRPILFIAPMIIVLLEGRKTQTRRSLPEKYRGILRPAHSVSNGPKGPMAHEYDRSWPVRTPYVVGDRLWVRESYYQWGHWDPVDTERTRTGRQKWRFLGDPYRVQFDAPQGFRKGRHHNDPETPAWHKRLGRFMPRRLSRLTLHVTDVRVERLQDISEADAIAEGIYVEQWKDVIDCLIDPAHANDFPPETPVYMAPDDDSESFVKMKAVDAFEVLWNSINGFGPHDWDANPWVCAISFDVHRANIDGGNDA